MTTTELLVDSYGFPAKSKNRHSKCTCEVPCQARFTCQAPHHVGSRATPWCNGAAENGPEAEWCDTCWCAVHAPEKAKPFVGVRIKFVD